MSDIKTRETQRNIKVLDKAKVASERIRGVGAHAKNTVGDLLDDGQISPEEYASEKLRYSAETVASEVENTASKVEKKLKEKIKKRAEKAQQEPNEPEVKQRKSPERMNNAVHEHSAETGSRQPTSANQRDSIRRQTTRSSEESTRIVRKSDNRTIKAKNVTSASEKSKRTLKSAQNSSRKAIKTALSGGILC